MAESTYVAFNSDSLIKQVRCAMKVIMKTILDIVTFFSAIVILVPTLVIAYFIFRVFPF